MGGIVLPPAIVGYRGWNIGPEGHLHPPHRRSEATTPWKPRGIASAVCVGGRTLWSAPEPESRLNEPPAHANCNCGLYGHYLLKDALAKEESNVDVLGVFVGFGPTAFHDSGFRSGRGRIIALTHGGKHTTLEEIERIKEVASLYEVPFIPSKRKLRKEAARWGEHRKPTRRKSGLSSGYRSPAMAAAQAAAYGFMSNHYQHSHYQHSPGGSYHYGGVPPARGTVRVMVELALKPGVEVVRDSTPMGGYRFRIKGLDEELWTITSGTVQQSIEPLPFVAEGGKYPMIAPMSQRVTVNIEASVLRGKIEQELKALQQLGQPLSMQQMPVY